MKHAHSTEFLADTIIEYVYYHTKCVNAAIPACKKKDFFFDLNANFNFHVNFHLEKCNIEMKNALLVEIMK